MRPLNSEISEVQFRCKRHCMTWSVRRFMPHLIFRREGKTPGKRAYRRFGIGPEISLSPLDSSTLGIQTRKYGAVTHKNAAVSHITTETPRENGFPGFALAEGTIPTCWFTSECISMVSSSLPFVWAY